MKIWAGKKGEMSKLDQILYPAYLCLLQLAVCLARPELHYRIQERAVCSG
ncbi:hypothetical protein KCTCHS21_23670 [Cohnella abietis]|uniref:Uncharacterized protein n=1 Tax=Cohnella abietis TaxID=2507935 RepID=A0A3T1D4K5_9BACL|nr:hypothetical protein KCTCHS21_23670 [Cohnella abietis]